MRKIVALATLLAASLTCPVEADTFRFHFAGSGVSGLITLTYKTTTDAKYSQAFEITGVTGTFSDSNHGLNIVNAPIGLLKPIKHDTPEATNFAAPYDFSKFAVAAGLPAPNHGFLTYDNLFYPTGSPQTASDYPFHGGFLDIYGLMFEIGGGKVVNFWSNGDASGTGSIDYGVAVATKDAALDYVGGGVLVPELAPESKACKGTYYAVEGGASPSGYSLWTFSEDGSVVSNSAAQPATPFSTAQGNWRVVRFEKNYALIKSTTFVFSGPSPNPSYPYIGRVEANFKFKGDCSATIPGASTFSITSCDTSAGPLCNNAAGVANIPIQLTRVSK
jgi:hypothetical protein